MPGPAVGEIVTVDRGHHDMGEAELGDGVGDTARLVGVERVRQPGTHIAKGAGAGAGLAHDHEGRVALVPTLADVGAARLLADGSELVPPHQRPRLSVDGGTRRFDPDPGGLAGDRLVWPMRLLGVARAGAPGVFSEGVDEPSHWIYLAACRT